LTDEPLPILRPPHPDRPRLEPPAAAPRRALIAARIYIAILILVFVGIGARVAQLQIAPSPQIEQRLDGQYGRIPMIARRGAIVDVRGRPLAITSLATRLFIDTKLIDHPMGFGETVGNELGYDPVAVDRAIGRNPHGRFIVIDHRMDKAAQQRLADLDLPGLATQRWPARDYPHGVRAGQLLGGVGREGDGLEGIELSYNAQLDGREGRLRYLRDVARAPMWVDHVDYRPPRDGMPVRLSIDLFVQAIAEDALKAACEQFEAEAGQVIVMNPWTGEVLAMANWPAYDPATISKTPPEVRRNRCVTDAFEPGSIFKPFVWAVATERNAANPKELIDCTTSGVYVSPRGRRLRDSHAVGEVTWAEVLIHSSNIGMAIVAQRMGETELYQAVKRFEFGQPTGSDLPGESPGIVNPRRQWNHYSVTSVPMGQEIAATPLQMVRAFCAITNGGTLVTPTIVPPDDRRLDARGHEVLSLAAAEQTRDVLRRVVTEGTGTRADTERYAVFGKTGTAQSPDLVNGGYLDKKYVASFIGGAPFEAPQVVVGCFVRHPNAEKGYYGSQVAAPVVSRVIDETLTYLGQRAERRDAPTAMQD